MADEEDTDLKKIDPLRRRSLLRKSVLNKERPKAPKPPKEVLGLINAWSAKHGDAPFDRRKAYRAFREQDNQKEEYRRSQQIDKLLRIHESDKRAGVKVPRFGPLELLMRAYGRKALTGWSRHQRREPKFEQHGAKLQRGWLPKERDDIDKQHEERWFRGQRLVNPDPPDLKGRPLRRKIYNERDWFRKELLDLREKRKAFEEGKGPDPHKKFG